MDKDQSTPEFDPFANEKPRPGRASGLLAALALLVALAVAAWNGWGWWQARQAAATETDLGAELSQAEQRLAALEQGQRDLGRRLDSLEGLGLEETLKRLEDGIDQARSVAGSDRARMAALEESQAQDQEQLEGLESRVAALVVRGESPRKGLELAEVDYLLRSANERLRLYGDDRTADQALALADGQLASLDDPVYLPVRQAIARARLAMGEVHRPDDVALTTALAQLQSHIPGLPFPGQVTARTASGDEGSTEAPGIWARFKSAMSGLVSVRHQDMDASLVSLDDKDTVRQGLWLQIEAARLALLRRDATAYQAALQRAQATVTQYFDADAPAVKRFQDQLGGLADTPITVDWPDISEPWTRLRSIRNTAATGAAANAPMPATRAAASPGASGGPAAATGATGADASTAEPDAGAPADDDEGDGSA